LQADLDKPETLKAAIKGAYGVFSVTNFLEKLNAAPEIVQGKAVADICKVRLPVAIAIGSSQSNMIRLRESSTLSGAVC
jgi:uncharacterized protein YbjT (DUF2867 family)